MLGSFIKKWVIYSLLSFFTLGIYLRTGKPFFIFLFWFMLTYAVLSYLFLGAEYFFSGLSFRRRHIRRLTEDESLELRTEVNNSGYFPVFNFILEDFLPCAALRRKNIPFDYLGPKKSRVIYYSCFCYKRGKYRLGGFSVYFFDPFGFFFLKKTFDEFSELYVYPRTFRIRKFPPLSKGVIPWFGIETTHISGDEDEFFGVREYRPGDPIKRIHWLSSARKNTLIVKEFQRQSYFRATVIFNLDKERNYGEGKHTVAEYIIKIAASVCQYLLERNVSVELIAHVGRMVHIPFNKGPEHLEDILKFLTIAEAESHISLGELLQEFSEYIPDNSSLIAIMHEEDRRYLPLLLSVGQRNVSLLPVVVISETFISPLRSEQISKETMMEFSHPYSLNTKFFSCGQDPETIFE